MLIPAEALRKARQGGWHECRGFQFTRALRGPGGHSVVLARQGTDQPMIKKVWPEAVALDANFWQGLGEALGWSRRDVGRGYSGWADTAHRFYDLMFIAVCPSRPALNAGMMIKSTRAAMFH